MYSIGLASRLSGVAPETIRVWERRYQLPQPGRSAGGHRQYSEDDVELLRALKSLTDAGARIGTLAQQPREEILRAARLAGDRLAPERGRPPDVHGDFADMVEGLVSAARLCDTDRAEEILDRPLLHRHARDVVLGLYLPLLREVGDLWHAGELSIASEHFVEKLITGRIHSVLVNQPSREGPEALCACLPGERHEVGLLASAVLLKDAGFRVTYLGADLPVHELKDAVSQRRPRLVVLSATLPPQPKVVDELIAAVQAPDFGAQAIVVGGLGAQDLTRSERLTRCDSLDDLERLARTLATAS